MKIYKINQIKHKRILGRNIKNACEKENLALFWGASGLEINVKSQSIYVNFSSDFNTFESWVSVFINDSFVSRFVIPKGKNHQICIAQGLNPNKENLITIYKDTQPMPDDEKHSLFIEEISICDEGEFLPLKPKSLSIEFIGDSVTSGEGLYGSFTEDDWITPWFSASQTYAAKSARKLNADFDVVSLCGWGINWGWDGNVNSSLPPHYENVCSVMKGEFQNSLGANEKFDFQNGKDIVVIHLGYNDENAFSQPTWKDEKTGFENKLTLDENKMPSVEIQQKIQKSIEEFLAKVRKFNKNAKIIWMYGMILGNILPKMIEKAVKSFCEQNNDKKIFTLACKSMEELEISNEDKGSRFHPGNKTHNAAAENLVKLINDILVY